MTWKVPDNFFFDRLNQLKRFNTLQEKNALLVEDTEPVSSILKELTDLTPINELEAQAFLLKLREISVGDEIELIVTCPHCNTMNNPFFPIEKCFNKIPLKFKGKKIPYGLFTTPETIINTDNLSLKDYSKLEKLLKEQNNNLLKLRHGFMCRKCNQKIFIDIDPRKVFSKSTLTKIYDDYVKISMFTHNGKQDIDLLYPFERELYQTLIEAELAPKGE